MAARCILHFFYYNHLHATAEEPLSVVWMCVLHLHCREVTVTHALTYVRLLCFYNFYLCVWGVYLFI